MIDKINIDSNMFKRDRSTAFVLNQHDAGIFFRVNLFNPDETPYKILENETVTIEWRKPNKYPYLQTTDIVKGDNYVEFEIKEAITQFVGIGYFNIIIQEGEVRKGTLKREFEIVETGLGTTEISQDYLDNQVVDILDELYADFKDLKYKFDDHLRNHPGGSGTGGGGTGGGGGFATATIISTLDKTDYQTGETIEIPVFYTSPNAGNGTIYVMINNIEKIKTSIPMGDNTINLTNIEKGSHSISIYVVDSAGVYSNKVTHNVNVGSLEILSTFNFDKDYSVTSSIKIPLTVTSISSDPITLTYTVGSYSYSVTVVAGYNSITLPALSPGVYKVVLKATSGKYTSNTITGNIVVLADDNLFVSTMTENGAVFEEGTIVSIDYRISMKNVTNFNVIVNIDGALYKTLTVKAGTNYLTLPDLAKGTHSIEFVVSDINATQTYTLLLDIFIDKSSFEAIEPVTQGLLCWFDAKGKGNGDTDRASWNDKSGNGVTVNFYGLNYKTNGWIDNALILDGTSYAEINLSPFTDDAEYGLTIDIQYIVENTGDEAARLIDCTTEATSGAGIYADVNEISLTSMSQTKKTPHSEQELTRATFVIDRDRQLGQIYINAVMCETMILNDTSSSLESFQHGNKILLNTNFAKSKFGRVKIYNIRVYERALSHEEILKNHISDLTTRAEQQEKWNFNYNDTMPTMYLYGDTTAMTKDNAVLMRVKYISSDTEKYGQSFDLDGAQSAVSWQGTSSLQYAVKNYKLKLKDNNGNKYKHELIPGCPETNVFCLKADYMESSHVNNTGIANFVNDKVYDNPNPPQQDNSNIRTSIAGFPIKLYINDVLMGVFNFNLDKGSNEAFGLTNNYHDCISLEVAANTDTTAGAFYKWTEDMTKTMIEYYTSDFEIRYAEDEEDATIWDCLHTLITWVNDADDETFAAEFEEHFNKEYVIKYYLVVMVFGMVDNLGKNMMLNTWDRKIWYPNFYDNDTALGLDNSGFLRIDSDCEIEAGTFNTSASLLWTKLARVFDVEIKETYKSMRSNQFRLENMYTYFITNQTDEIPERLYNLDAEAKYIPYKRTYAHMIHGNRKEHMKKWLRERLLYLDSLLGYDEQLANFITIRANKQGEVSLNISTYSPIYLSIKWRNGEIETKRIGRNETVTFSSTLPTATDQEVLIYAAEHLKTISGISNLTPSALMISNATRLTELICSSKKLLSVAVENNTYLKTIDLSGSTALGTSTVTDIDVSACTNLTTLKLNDTSLTKIVFNPGGMNIATLYLPNTLKTLDIINMPNLKEINNNYNSKLTSLKVVDMPESTKSIIYKLTNSSLETIYFDSMYLTILNLLNMTYLANLTIINSQIDTVYYPTKTIEEYTTYYFEDEKVTEAIYTVQEDKSTVVMDKSSTILKILRINYTNPAYIYKTFVLPDTIEQFIYYTNMSYTTRFARGIYLGSNTTHDTDYTDIDLSNKEFYDLALSGYNISNLYNLNVKAHYYVIPFYEDVEATGVIDYSELAVNKVSNYNHMFRRYSTSNPNMENLTIIPPTSFADLYSDINNFVCAFYECDKIPENTVIALLNTLSTGSIKNMLNCFAGTPYNIKNILESFIKISLIGDPDMSYLFENNTCTGDLGEVNINFPLATSIGMFKGTHFESAVFNFKYGMQSLEYFFQGNTNLKNVTINFGDSTIYRVTGITTLSYAFLDCANVESIEINYTGSTPAKNTITTGNNVFTGCNALTHFVTNLRIDYDIFASLPAGVVLDAESITSIVNALVDNSGGSVKNITLSGSMANITGEQLVTITSKNWNII